MDYKSKDDKGEISEEASTIRSHLESIWEENIWEASKRELELAVKAEELVTENAEEKLKMSLRKLSDIYSGERLAPMVTRPI